MTDTAVEPIVPGSLRDTIRKEIDGYLRDPLAFPSEFVSWIPQRVEQVGIVTPQSNVIGSYTTADSVAGLGTPIHGKTVMLRVGASPYHFAQLTFDDVYHKWVASTVMTASISGLTIPGSTSGVMTNLTEPAAYQRSQIPGFKAFYDAGLRPQTTLLSMGAAGNTGQTVSLRATLYEFTSGDTSLNKIAHGTQIDWTTTTQTWKTTAGWSDVTFTSTPAENEGILSVQYSTSTNGGVWWNITALLRWVANPV